MFERESLFKITSVRKEFLLVLIQLNLGLLFSGPIGLLAMLLFAAVLDVSSI